MRSGALRSSSTESSTAVVPHSPGASTVQLRRQNSLTRKQLDTIYKEPQRFGAMGLFCDPVNEADASSSSGSDNDEYYRRRRRGRYPSDEDLTSFDDTDYDSEESYLRRQSSFDSMMSTDSMTSDDQLESPPPPGGGGSKTLTSEDQTNFVSERQNSFEDRENELAAAIADIRATQQAKLTQKRERRKSLREREQAMKRREEARRTGGLKLPPIGSTATEHDKGSIAAAMARTDNGDSDDEEEDGDDPDRKERKTEKRKKKVKQRTRGEDGDARAAVAAATGNKSASLDTDNDNDSDRRFSPRTSYADDQSDRDRAATIVEEAERDRKQLVKSYSAEQGRQRGRSQHKRVQNFFQMDSSNCHHRKRTASSSAPHSL